MELQLTKGENLRMVDLKPGSFRAKSKVIRKGPFAEMSVKELKLQREQSRDIIEKSLAFESRLNELEKLVNELTQQHLICTGHIQRKSVWQRTDRLNKPLTQEERNLIRRIKSKCKPIPLFKKHELTGI